VCGFEGGLTFTLSTGVPEDGTLLDGAETLEHLPNVVLGVLFGEHAHEEFPL
jgi:hypothetical protein